MATASSAQTVDDDPGQASGANPAMSFFHNASHHKTGRLSIQVVGRDMHVSTYNITVQRTPPLLRAERNQHLGLISHTAPRRSTISAILDFCRLVSCLVLCRGDQTEGSFHMERMGADVAVDLPPSLPPTHQEIYVRALLRNGLGLPCWEPTPSQPNMQPDGVVPGDVGTYTVDLSFKKLFNLWDDESSIRTLASTCSAGPYQPLQRRTISVPMLRDGETLREGAHATSHLTTVSTTEPTVVHEFHCLSLSGAVLALTAPADLFSTDDKDAIQSYIVQHVDAIYRHACSICPVGERESLYVITGSIKSESWAIAAYYEEMHTSHNTLRLVRLPLSPQEGLKHQWREQGTSRARVGPSIGSGLQSQALFLQGFKVAFTPRFRSRIAASSLDSHTMAPASGGGDSHEHNDTHPPDPEPRPQDEGGIGHGKAVGQAGGSSIGSWSLTLNSAGSTPKVTLNDDDSRSAIDNEGSFTEFPRSPEIGYHPSDSINSQLLEKTSAEVAICHDDDWRGLFKSCIGNSSSAMLPSSRSEERRVCVKNGLVFLLPKGCDEVHLISEDQPRTVNTQQSQSNEGSLLEMSGAEKSKRDEELLQSVDTGQPETNEQASDIRTFDAGPFDQYATKSPQGAQTGEDRPPRRFFGGRNLPNRSFDPPTLPVTIYDVGLPDRSHRTHLGIDHPDITPNAQHDEPVSTCYTALQTAVDLVVEVSDVFPPLKSAAAGVKALMDIHEAFTSDQEEFVKLVKRIKFLDKILRDRPPFSGEVEDRRDGLARAVKEFGKELEKKTSQSELERLVSSMEGKQELLRLIREINFAIEFAMLDVVVSNEGMTLRAVEGIDWLKGYLVEESQKKQKDSSAIARDVETLKKSEQLKKLRSVTGYGLSPDAPQCVEGSRVALIARLLAWAEDPSSVHAFWLSGMAGTGKTAVSRTFCHQLIRRGLLGASFFCSIKVQDLSDIRNIIPSLAKTLAERHPKFGDALTDVLESGIAPLVDEMKLSEQYEFLIIRPAEAAFRDLDKSIILCTDALDECRALAALKEFLDTILSKKPVGQLKFFFTSRPEVAIRQAVEASSHSSHKRSLRLHDIEEDIVRADIKLYVNHELSKIPQLREEYGECWPPHEIDMIIEGAGTLFIVAATIVRGIVDAGNPVARLQSYGTTMGPGQSSVYSLYRATMDKALENLRPIEEGDVYICLSLLVAARRPLSLVEYGALLDRPASAIRAAFRSLHSVVEIPSDVSPISTHASFVDFLTGVHDMDTRETRPPWAVDRREAHSMALERCLTLMESNDLKKGLYFGVSGALTSYESNEGQLSPRLRSDLAYACTSWGNHVLDGMPISDALQQRIKSFLVTRGLYWLEALSAERSVGYSNILWDVSKHMTVDGGAALLVEIRDFAQMFATPISHSAPHLYLSAVPFQQFSSPESVSWLPRIPSTPIVHTTQRSHHKNSRVLVDPIPGHFDCVTSVAFSPNGNKIVSGSEDQTIRVWDVQTGQAMLDPIHGHSSSVTSVAFSPDSSRIVSGSADETIRVWDAQNGHTAIGPIWGHSNTVTSVAFSPDGSKIVSGSRDKTIRIWEAKTGQAMLDPIQGHSDWVTSVAFSPDGSKVVSGSEDQTIRVWDVQTGQAMLGPIKGHSDWATSVAFSPDGSKIASGSADDTIRVWDAQTGQAMLDPIQGHSDWVTSVVFSPDGSTVTSGSKDKTIHVWDSQNGQPMLDPIQGHSDWVTSVAFSPDGSKIVSGSKDKTVRVWNVQSRAPDLGAVFLHDYGYPSLIMDEEGWVRNLSNDLLLWIPPQFRHSLYMPPVQFIIGLEGTKVELSHALYHGTDWKKCTMPRQEGPLPHLPWPIHTGSTSD